MYHLYHTISNGFKFSHIHKLKIEAISYFSNKNYKNYLNQPMQMIEQKLGFIIAKNPQLINSLKRSSDLPLIRKYIDVPLKD